MLGKRNYNLINVLSNDLTRRRFVWNYEFWSDGHVSTVQPFYREHAVKVYICVYRTEHKRFLRRLRERLSELFKNLNSLMGKWKYCLNTALSIATSILLRETITAYTMLSVTACIFAISSIDWQWQGWYHCACEGDVPLLRPLQALHALFWLWR